MELRIQYARANDGATIAFWQVGDGPTVIQMPSIPFTHIQMEWEDPDWRAWFDALGNGVRLVRYDSRGCGLSWAESPTFSLDAMVDDLSVVADRAGGERFSIIAPVQAGPAALVYAARNPRRVARIILWCAISRADELRTSSFEALRTLSHTDWGLFAEAAAHALVAGWDNADAAHRMAAIMRESASAEIHEAVLTDYLATDISDDLGRVTCPVLVAYRMEGSSPLPSSARYLASALPNASLLAFPGSSLLFVVSDAPAIAEAFRGFLLAEPPPGPGVPAPSGFQTLLYTDIEGHTAIIQQLGDDRGRQVLRHHERITRSAIEAHRGNEALATGDGFLVRFSTAVDALRCATDIQRRLADISAELPVELRVRVGINAGEPIVEGGGIHGSAVVTARRVAAQGSGGEVMVANVIRELAAGKGFAFRPRGPLPGRPGDEPLLMWELLWAHAAT